MCVDWVKVCAVQGSPLVAYSHFSVVLLFDVVTCYCSRKHRSAHRLLESDLSLRLTNFSIFLTLRGLPAEIRSLQEGK